MDKSFFSVTLEFKDGLPILEVHTEGLFNFDSNIDNPSLLHTDLYLDSMVGQFVDELVSSLEEVYGDNYEEEVIKEVNKPEQLEVPLEEKGGFEEGGNPEVFAEAKKIMSSDLRAQFNQLKERVKYLETLIKEVDRIEGQTS